MAIKPDMLWALCKTTPPHTLGRVMAAVGRQSVVPPLSEAEQSLANVIEQASAWMDEAAEKARAEWRDRTQAFRQRRKSAQPPNVTVTDGVSRDVTVTDTMSRDVTVTDTMSRDVTLNPSIHPSINAHKCACVNAHAHEGSDSDQPPSGAPTLDEVLEAARLKRIPEAWARKWHADMAAQNFAYVSKGSTATINRRNFIAVMRNFHRIDAKNGELGDGAPDEAAKAAREAAEKASEDRLRRAVQL